MLSDPPFEGCAFLGLSVDNFIARSDGDLSWLTNLGEVAGDAGFTEFIESIDALLIGRGTYHAIADQAEWPFLGRPVHVLSRTLPMISLDLSRLADNHALISVLMTCASAWMESALTDPAGGHRRVVYDEPNVPCCPSSGSVRASGGSRTARA